MNPIRPALALASFALLATPTLFAQQPAPKIDPLARGRAHDMLHQTYNEVRKNYYDPTFHGVDLEARYHEFDAKIDQVKTQGEGFRVIAGFLSGLHDSHLFFAPPPRPYRYDMGFRSQVIGDMVYVTNVRPATDATEKLTPGDRIVHLDGYNDNRHDNHDLMYYFHTLAPAAHVNLDITTPGGQQKQVGIDSKMIPRQMQVNLDTDDVDQLVRDEEGDEHISRERYAELGDIFIWKMPEFGSSYSQVDDIIKKARKHKTLILDLRGNPGGSIETLKAVVGHLFDHDVKIFDEVSRKETKAITAKTAGDHAFTGKLIVLIDSGSASCAELLPRVVQLEHRGTAIGDLSAGAVMESIQYREGIGGDSMVVYVLSITHANALMTDGKSLETVGVMPEERILPSPDDLADSKDPVLARAISLAGGSIDSTAAAKLFPFEWPSL